MSAHSTLQIPRSIASELLLRDKSRVDIEDELDAMYYDTLYNFLIVEDDEASPDDIRRAKELL